MKLIVLITVLVLLLVSCALPPEPGSEHIVAGYYLVRYYDEQADVVCWFRNQGMFCMPRSDTALTVEQARDVSNNLP